MADIVQTKALPEDREPVSAFVICMNEEDHIAECLKSLSFCDELIVIDSFSTDRTVEIAEQCGAKVFRRVWTGYRDQKAYGLSLINHEWTVNLDADERVSEELGKNILNILRLERQNKLANKITDQKNEIVGYYINRVVYYLGRWWRKGGWFPEYRLRFFKKSKVSWGGIDPHEKPIPDGKTAKMGGEILHFTYDNMDQQFSRLLSYASIAAREDYKRGVKPSIVKLITNPILRATKFYLLKKGYREGIAGFIVAIAEGYYAFVKYARLWECEFLKNQEKNGQSSNKSS